VRVAICKEISRAMQLKVSRVGRGARSWPGLQGRRELLACLQC
jgi:hypothetical protein